jgi:hypothetical protein
MKRKSNRKLRRTMMCRLSHAAIARTSAVTLLLTAAMFAAGCGDKTPSPVGTVDGGTVDAVTIVGDARDAVARETMTADASGGGTNDVAPAPGPMTTTATKFCHEIVDLDTGEPIEAELVVGSTRFKTRGDGCATPAEQTCVALPTGKVTARVFDRGVEAFRNELSLVAGRDYVFSFRVDEETGEGEIFALPVPAGLTCAAAKLSDVPLPAPVTYTPPPAGSMSELKICNGLTKPSGSAPGVLEVISEKGLRLSASPGACAPAKGVACSKIAAGEDALTFLLDGEEIGSADVRYPANGGLVVIPRTINADEFLIERIVVPADVMCAAYEPL